MATLDHYLEMFRRYGEAGVLDELSCPVLIDSPHVSDPDGEQDGEFRTAAVWVEEVAASTRTPAQREVYRVDKREGATFSTHVSIGRTSNLDICLPLPAISKFHAYIRTETDGTHTLTDKGSTNGSSVDGQPLVPGEPVRLEDGCAVTFAKHHFVFYNQAGVVRLLRELSRRR